MILTILSMIAAVASYACSQLVMHGKFKWTPSSVMSFGHGSFFGSESWKRKYKYNNGTPEPAPQTWYYKFFKIPYREAFPLSATILSFVTDFYHLSQMLFKIFLALSFAPLTGWIWAGVIWVLWGISFTIFYRLLSR